MATFAPCWNVCFLLLNVGFGAFGMDRSYWKALSAFHHSLSLVIPCLLYLSSKFYAGVNSEFHSEGTPG